MAVGICDSCEKTKECDDKFRDDGYDFQKLRSYISSCTGFLESDKPDNANNLE